MEVTSTTLKPLAHYDTSRLDDADTAGEPIAGPSNVTVATAAFKKELEDRTFDVDDEEFELEQAFERGEEEGDDNDSAASGEENNSARALEKQESRSTSQKSDTKAHSDSSSSPDEALYSDVFSEETADSMIKELKEIGNGFYLFRCSCHRYVCQYLLSTFQLCRDVPLHTKIHWSRACTSSKTACRIRRTLGEHQLDSCYRHCLTTFPNSFTLDSLRMPTRKTSYTCYGFSK
jgi:hypothetical protein